MARVRLQCVVDLDRAVRIGRNNAMKQQVHRAEPRRIVDDLPAVQRLLAELPLLVGIEQPAVRDVLVRS